MPTLFILQAQAYKRLEWGISTQVFKTPGIKAHHLEPTGDAVGLTTREALQAQCYPDQSAA